MMMNMFAAAMIFAALMVISPAAAERSPAPNLVGSLFVVELIFRHPVGVDDFPIAGLIELECE